jgi:hypothetical protein
MKCRRRIAIRRQRKGHLTPVRMTFLLAVWFMSVDCIWPVRNSAGIAIAQPRLLLSDRVDNHRLRPASER